jgi:predicted nucleic acid-binding protein
MSITNRNSKIALDTNVLIYAVENEDERKRQISIGLLSQKPFITHFVFNEFLYVLHSKKNKDKKISMKLGIQILDIIELMHSNKDTYKYAYLLISKHQFRLYDSIIVADAVLNNCTILYTEDMNHNQLVDKKIKIVNPYKEIK